MESQELERARQELAYVEYRKQAIEEFIRTNYTAQEFSEMVRRKKEELLQTTHWKRIYILNKDSFDSLAERQTKAELASRIGILSFGEFVKEYKASLGKATTLPLEYSSPATAPSVEQHQLVGVLKN